MNPYAKPKRGERTLVSSTNIRQQSHPTSHRRPLHALSASSSASTQIPSHKTCPVQSKTGLELLRMEQTQRSLYAQLSWFDTTGNDETKNRLPPWFHLTPGVIELAGPGGSGKSQLALSLCLRAARLSQTALYLSLSSHDKIVSRLQQMANHDTAVLDRIWTRRCPNLEEFFAILDELQSSPDVRDKIQPRLIVIDSIADVFRLDHTDMIQRSIDLFRVAETLQKQVRDSLTPLTVLCINQVTTDFQTSGWAPALGLSWAHCIHTKFRLDRNESNTTRTLTLSHSPQYPSSSLKFTIEKNGCKLEPT